MITTVNSTSALLAALKSAHGGDTILLAAGTYNSAALTNLNFSTAVTIASADPSHQAVLNNLVVSGSTGLAFEQVELTTSTGTAATIASSHNITFTDDMFDGSVAGTGNAMMIRNGSDGVTVTGSDFGTFGTGINELTANNVTISNNTFHGITGGAIRGTDATNEIITGNTFSDASSSNVNHTDVVYLWQDNTANHVTISNNVYGASSSTGTQTSSVGSIGSTGSTPISTGSTTTTSTGSSTGSSTTTSSPPPSTGSALPMANTASTAIATIGGTSSTSTAGHDIVTVSNTTDLVNAVRTAHSGETIELQAGTYSAVGLNSININGTVTITSADDSHEAVINGLSIGGSSGLSLDHLSVVAPETGYGVSVGNSSNISLSDITVQGTAGAYLGVGMFVRNSNNVSITNSDVSQVGSGIGHLDDSNLTISNNTIHNIGTDGVYGGGSSHVIVSGNTFTDFNPPTGAHPDAIQFFAGTTGAQGSDVVITNNVITRGDGAAIQGIFIESTNHIDISGNAMSGTMYNGIGLSTSSDALIEDNFVQGYTDMGTRIIIRGASSDVTVMNNTSQEIDNYAADGANPNYEAGGNTIIGGAAIGDLSAMDSWLSQHTGATVVNTAGLGDDTVIGTAGADTMTGGLGDDLFIVNNAGDVVNAPVNGGIYTVDSSIASYTLAPNVSNLVLTGTSAQTGIGNNLNDVLVSNGVQSTLIGGTGDDTLIANGGAATLTGGAGDDVFSIAKVPTSPVVITDFTSGKDQLDLHSLLANYHGTDPVADKWVEFQASSSGLTVLVDTDGPTGSAGFMAVAKLNGVSSLSSSDWIFH